MPYVKKTIKAGDTIEIHKGYSGRIGKRIARGVNVNPTPKDVQEVNRRNAEAKLRWIFNANFVAKDLHLVPTYRKDLRPPPWLAKQHLEQFMRGVRAIFKKQGKPLKYVSCTSYGSEDEDDAGDEELEAMHHHIVMSSVDVRELLDLWPYGCLRPTYLYKRWGVNDFSKLASYIIKQTDKIYQLPDSPSRKRYNSSRNLTIPIPEVEIVSADTWTDKPKPLKGYTLIETSIRDWTCAVTGRRCQEYRMVAKPPKSEPKAKPRRNTAPTQGKKRDSKKSNENRRC